MFPVAIAFLAPVQQSPVPFQTSVPFPGLHVYPEWGQEKPEGS